MTYANSRAAATYARLDLESDVSTASPQRLIVMLYDGAIGAMRGALVALAGDDQAARQAQISKAVAIISEGLRPALDPEAGGEIAANLGAIYSYVIQRLIDANRNADAAPIQEALALMGELKEAWDNLVAGPRPLPLPAEVRPLPEARAALSYGRA